MKLALWLKVASKANPLLASNLPLLPPLGSETFRKSLEIQTESFCCSRGFRGHLSFIIQNITQNTISCNPQSIIIINI